METITEGIGLVSAQLNRTGLGMCAATQSQLVSKLAWACIYNTEADWSVNWLRYLYIYVLTYVCTSARVCKYICTHICMVGIYVCMCVYVCIKILNIMSSKYFS